MSGIWRNLLSFSGSASVMGYEGGQLTEWKPYCVVLLDEIEKHTDVLICYYKS
jgi:ATP-dependent Clp protease ATP-binding subunit ClpA